MKEMHSGLILAHAVRLEPGDDLVPCLLRAARLAAARRSTTTISSRVGAPTNAAGASSSDPTLHRPATTTSSCVVLTAVGSLASLTIRLANASALPTSPTLTHRQAVSDPKPDDDVAVTAASTTFSPDTSTGLLSNDNIHPPLPSSTSSDMSCFRTWNECLEVTSLVGTFAVAAEIESATTATCDLASVAKHLHITVSDGCGRAFGGHLVSGVVHTTLELVLGTLEGVDFRREPDPRTGYGELVVETGN
jgi:predicted DNA-binding protein with PD1-like motif